MGESNVQLKQRALAIVARLGQDYPEIRHPLDFENPLQCTIATILSAQCTDARVNMVTPALFRKYPTIEAFANASQEELENDIRSTGFFRNKATAIRKCCAAILEKHGGQVPDTMEELLQLDGIGRKTANCVLGNAYGKPAVMVDTHVKRLSYRMGLTSHTDPDKIEFDIKALLPENQWMTASHLLIIHGRRICKSRNPQCTGCSIYDLCQRNGLDINEETD